MEVKIDSTELRKMLQEATKKQLTLQAIKVQTAARQNCPVDNGTLRRSISYVITGTSPESMVARVGSNVEYALYVEEGTGIYGPKRKRIVPRTKEFLRFMPKGAANFVFARSVKGMPGRHYLARAIQSAFR